MGKYLAMAWVVVLVIFVIETKTMEKPLGIGAAGIVLLLIVSLIYFIIRLFRKNKTSANTVLKDSWYITYREFLHVFYFWLFVLILSIGMYATKQELVQKITPIDSVQFFSFGILWLSLCLLFKNRNKIAIPIGYISIIILLTLSLIEGFQLILILIYGYFLYRIYRASKVVKSIEGSNTDTESQVGNNS